MSSGGKGAGGAGETKDYGGTILGVVCVAPIRGIASILLNGEQIFGAEGPLLYGESGVGNPYELLIPERGLIRIGWGLEDQTADATLALYGEHPAYRGFVTILLVDFWFGTEVDTPPTIQVVVIADPAQAIVTGDAAEHTTDDQVNPVAMAAEILTAWHGLGLAAGQLDAASFQATADELEEPELQALAACSPLWDEATQVKGALGDLGALADLWWRLDDQGRVQVGRWRREGPLGAVTVIDANVWENAPRDGTADLDDVPNGFDVVVSDRTQLWKETTVPVNDLRALRLGEEPRRRQLARSHLITSTSQAGLHGAEAVRLQGNPTVSGSVVVRRSRAVTPGGAPLRPGDYFLLDLDPTPGGAGLLKLCRCTGRSFGPTGPVTLDYELDPAAAPIPYAPDYSDALPEPRVVRPQPYQRTLSLLPAPGEAPGIQLLALRREADVVGVELLYDDDIDGDYTLIGTQSFFALPLTLKLPVSTTATTLRLGLLTGFGVPTDLDAYLIREAVGVSGATAARNNELLVVLVAKDTTSGDAEFIGDLHWLEVCSVVAVEQVADGVWDVEVLRSVLGTTALAFDTEGGTTSFPDGFVRYEAWVIPRRGLVTHRHIDFARLQREGGTGYFTFTPFTRRGDRYDPVTAYDAAMQPVAGRYPKWPYAWPIGYDRAPRITWSTPSTSIGSTDTAGDITVAGSVTDRAGDLIALRIDSRRTDDGSAETTHLDAGFPATGTRAWSLPLTFAGHATEPRVYTVRVEARDREGQTTVETRSILRVPSGGGTVMQPPTISPPDGTEFAGGMGWSIATAAPATELHWRLTDVGAPPPSGSDYTVEPGTGYGGGVSSSRRLWVRSSDGTAHSPWVSADWFVYYPGWGGGGVLP